jgi:hypothetical protein
MITAPSTGGSDRNAGQLWLPWSRLVVGLIGIARRQLVDQQSDVATFRLEEATDFRLGLVTQLNGHALEQLVWQGPENLGSAAAHSLQKVRRGPPVDQLGLALRQLQSAVFALNLQ